MNTNPCLSLVSIVAASIASVASCQGTPEAARTQRGEAQESGAALGDRMEWWRDARFGMFIHWGLYAVPAGKWGTTTTYGEWIRDSARIPVGEYEKLVPQFNPVKFDADAWVRLAKGAGMKYIVITSKHHDGFALFDSKETDYDVMSTPYGKDIMKQLAAACAAHDIKMCWYHSIMDWHHPDYLPRRPWEKEQRPSAGADFDRYVGFMKGQLKELLTNYGAIGVLWFDGQWEGTWTPERGRDLEAFVRSLQPNVIINSRVGRAGGAYGVEGEERVGDYATPEQFIPETDPGFDWETCMTMNGHWGYNAADKSFKSTKVLVRNLIDIASKGGNYLLNVGPTAEGLIPPESVDRLREIADWMEDNGESIHGTHGTPLAAPDWAGGGRVTMKHLADGNTRLYFHVFEWPADGTLTVRGFTNDPVSLGVLGKPLDWESRNITRVSSDSLKLGVPRKALSAHASVVVLDVAGALDPSTPPKIEAFADLFLGEMKVRLTTNRSGSEIRYTLDGTEPTPGSALCAGGVVALTKSGTVSARLFREGRAISPVVTRSFTLATPRASVQTLVATTPGLNVQAYTGDFKALPDFKALTPVKSGTSDTVNLTPAPSDDKFALVFTGFLNVPGDGVYKLSLGSDDGSRLFIHGECAIDHDGLHSFDERSCTLALAKGLHPVRVEFFERDGGADLKLSWQREGESRSVVPASAYTK